MFQILIIDDNSVNQLLLARTLKKQGYQVTTANDGEEGLALAFALHPALIICDWIMPKVDGLEVCRRIKADPTLSTTFFILLTSRGDVEDRVQGLDTGADDFLTKPFEMNELKARVRAGLRIYQLTQDLKSKNQNLAKLTRNLQRQQKILEEELSEAAAYVQSLLPAPIKGALTINTRFIPSRQLGGDCFDYFWLDPDFLVIYLIDVSGHGLGAALPSVAVLNLLRSQALESVNFYQPNQVLQALNENFQMDNQNAKYLTIWYGVYNRTDRQLIYANAGHPPAVLISTAPDRALQVRSLRDSSMPIGILPDTRYDNYYCDIGPDSVLYVFSDGVYEFLQPDDTIFGLPDFLDLLVHCSQRVQENGDLILQQILEQIQYLNGGSVFEDDFSLIQVNFG
ncbi:regulator [Leptolyngbya sp. 'hensonii']|uniref:PP2C family protein-serine/threonine phosphatase n=1 Tax=Leptolyngbya sp. 'hensonii' TaxID=1922337 RepID=UPI00094F9C6F|nr:SpoIIE family protein phosphatase [Leptolyngbya sp. 'hensonii']OLP16708.1 regulator [Leptolyngbya sp. 'hensonii']